MVPRLPPVCESGSFLDRDVKPERLKLPDVPTDSFLGVAPIEVVGPKLLVGHAVAHDVERNRVRLFCIHEFRRILSMTEMILGAFLLLDDLQGAATAVRF